MTSEAERCQHCYGRLSWAPSGVPGRGDRLVDHRGGFECVPGLEHKAMPAVPDGR